MLILLNISLIKYESMDTDKECCDEYEYNKCLDCKHDECLYEKCDIWDEEFEGGVIMDFEKQEKLIKELSDTVFNCIEDGECFEDKDILKNVFDSVDKLRTELGYYLDHFND